MVNYYVKLGLDRSLSCDALKTELGKLRRKWQTRANSGETLEARQKAERMMQLIRDASAVLLVEAERKKYDKDLDKDPTLSGQTASGGFDHTTPVDTSRMDEADALDALEDAYNGSKYNTVFALADRLIAAGNAPLRVYRLAASAHAECGNISQAEKVLRDMIKAMPDDVEAHYLNAFFNLRIFNGKTREARESIDFLLKSEEGASARVAALDVEYYIDIGDFALAEKKTEEYRPTVGRDRAFTESIGRAYRQHADSFLQEYGGDAYFDDKEHYTNWKKYCELSLSIYPDAEFQSTFQNNMKNVGGIYFVKANFPGILFALILGSIWVGGGGDVGAIGALFIAVGIFIAIFSFIPKWMAHRFGYTGHLKGVYEIARYAAKVVGVIFNAIVWVIKTIIQLIFAFI